MADRRVIFFDVGNTLLFPNRAKILAPISSDRHPSLDQWHTLERKTKHEFDQGMTSGRVDHSFWWNFILTFCGNSRKRQVSGKCWSRTHGVPPTGIKFLQARATPSLASARTSASL